MNYYKSIIPKIASLRKIFNNFETLIAYNFKINPSELGGIIVISQEEIISNKEFSDRLNISASRGSKIINGLIKKGILKETKVFEDRRVNNITLTKKGIKLQNKIDNIIINTERRIYKKFGGQEFDTFLNICENMTESLKNFELTPFKLPI